MSQHLVLIETSGNQNYIFATNKLRENVGASELTYRAGTEWVLEAIGSAEVGGPKNLWVEDTAELRRNLCDPQKNPPLSPETKVEVIIATSGKALLLVYDHDIGREIIRQVTMRALKDAPGLDVCGVISRGFDWEIVPLGDLIREVHEEFEEVRASRPGPVLRFLRLPITEECRSSGLPAAKLDKTKNDEEPRSIVSLRKSATQSNYGSRMQKLLQKRPDLVKSKINFAENIRQIEEDCDWLAVIHADGNGLGEIFLKFGKHAGCEQPNQNGQYVNDFRRFSLALDVCTEQAFLTALAKLLQRDVNAWFKLPILPIVLGGDDMTIVCDGKTALQFTRDFLSEFEAETRQRDAEHYDGIIPRVAQAALGDGRLSACAGIAIIKPHFPFSAAYDLAEELIKSAKQSKKMVLGPKTDESGRPVPWPCSAIDFHALYDSTSSELAEIRGQMIDGKFGGKLVVDGGQTRLYARPYVVTDSDKFSGAEEGQTWAQNHSWEKLKDRVEAILQSDKDDKQHRAIPNSQLHDLRAGLFLDKKAANARYDLISHRYEEDHNATITKLEEETGDKLFFEDEDSKHCEFSATKLLDAMEAANFWVKEELPKKGESK